MKPPMDASAISRFASPDTLDQVSVAVARKAQDAARQEGDAMVAMIRSAQQVAARGSGGAVGALGRTETGGVDTYA
jgi:hypothetical protein